MRFLFVIFLGLVAATGLLANERPAPTLAIVGPDETRAASDLLLAGLSSSGFATFVEREQIDQILGEQLLSLTSQADLLMLAEMTAADGVILLQVVKESDHTFLQVRLVATRPGVVFDLIRFPWSPQDIQELPERVKSRFEPLLPKLTVPERQAVPISILNFRSAVTSGTSAEIDRTVTLLVTSRLSTTPGIFLLERSSMDLLRGEKELSFDQSSFWAGSYLLEGIIDGDLVLPEEIVISARLISPEGETVPIEVKGPRNDLVAVVEELAAIILNELDHADAEIEWNVSDEAARYFEEGRWALRWRMHQEARQAAEAAWALGNRHAEVAALRARTYIPVTQSKNHLYTESHSAIQSETAGLRQVLSYHATTRPAKDAPADALRALQTYRSFSESFPVEDVKPDSDFYLAGIDVLEGVSKMLQHFHFTRGVIDMPTHILAEVRFEARKIASWLLAAPSIQESYIPTSSRDGFAESFARQRNILHCVAEWGHFWQESPEDALDHWRFLMSLDLYPELREKLLKNDARNPVLPAWNNRDAARVDDLWQGFLQELVASDDPLLRVEGRLLTAAYVATKPWQAVSRMAPEERATITHAFPVYRDSVLERHVTEATEGRMERAITSFYEEVRSSRESLARASTDRKLWWSVHTLERLAGSVVTPHRTRITEMMRENRNLLIQVRDEWNRQPEREAAELARNIRAEIMNSGEPVDLDTFRAGFSSTSFLTREETAQLMPLLGAYKAQIEAASKLALGDEKEHLSVLIREIEQIERRFEARMKAVVVPREPEPDWGFPREGVAEAEPIFVDRRLRLPVEKVGIAPDALLDFRASQVHENRLRIVAACQERGNHANPWILVTGSLDLDTQEWEVARAPVPPAQGAYHWQRLVIHGDSVAVSIGTRVLRWTWGSEHGHWEAPPVAHSPQLKSVEGRFFASDVYSILEIDEAGLFKVLASTRRNPPAGPVDELDRLERVSVLPSGDLHLRLFANNRIFDQTEDSWIEIHRFHGFIWAELHADLAIFRDESGRQAWILLPGSSSPRPLFDISLDRKDRFARQQTRSKQAHSGASHLITGLPARSSQENLAAESRLTPLEQVLDLSPAIGAHGDSLFFFHEHLKVADTTAGRRVEQKDGRHANLIHATTAGERVVVIPLLFEEFMPASDLHQVQISSFSSSQLRWQARSWSPGGTPFRLIPTENWLILLAPDSGWLIPRAEIEGSFSAK